MYRTDFWTLWEKARVGCFERTASKHVYYLGWNRSPAQVGCMRQVLGPGALGRPRGIGWRGRWEGGSGWGIHVTTWLIHVSIWENPLQYCQVISLQLIQINEKKKNWSSRRGRRWIGCEEGVKEARTVTQQATFTGNNKGTGSGSSWAQDSCSLNVCWVDLASLGYTIK